MTDKEIKLKYDITLKKTGETRTCYNHNAIISAMLTKGILHVSRLHAEYDEDSTPFDNVPQNIKDACAIFVNCNDLFSWAHADSILLKYNDIPDLYEHWIRDEVTIWCCKQRNMMPQKPIADWYREQGIDIDSYGWEKNPSDEDFED